MYIMATVEEKMDKDIQKVLISEEEIDSIVRRVASEIDADYAKRKDGRLILLCILKGSVVFMGDLMKRIRTPLEIEFMRVSSYGSGTVSSGNIRIILDVNIKDIQNCDILIVEDIIDSGRTLSYLVEYFKLKGARSVRTVTLLDKPARREVDFTPDYVGRQIPDEFVVGYGLDFDEKYRALPYVGVLDPKAYQGNL